MSIAMYGVSTFTTEFFRGNPAAVLVLAADEARQDAWYHRVSAMTAQPATAFLQPVGTGFGLRWFTPNAELTLCGHGTLAAAHVLYETAVVGPDDEVALTTTSGTLTVRSDGERRWVDFPAVTLHDEPAPAEVLEALGLSSAQWFGRSAHDLVVVLDSAEQVELVLPDVELLSALSTTRTIVTAEGGGADFTSRVFAPRIGLAEDQVTGSAHAALAPYWSDRLGSKQLTARQASARGGELALDVSGQGIVAIGGRAVTTSRGELLV